MEMEQAIGMFMVGPVGPMELVIIGVIAALIFGGKRLGDLGKGLGKGEKASATSGAPSAGKRRRPWKGKILRNPPPEGKHGSFVRFSLPQQCFHGLLPLSLS